MAAQSDSFLHPTQPNEVPTTPFFDAIIIGAGAAGLFCAGQAGQRGLKVLLIDHADKVAEKIRISGGGRCNFTNRDLDPAAPHKRARSRDGGSSAKCPVGA